ncbi:AraC family transcriptional regulator [Mucilaginibacter gynuensis]|uniref:AraC family transcriptional regulator n=1 Tax=Mucilaginibacter gynuensis TaxID=1302236 RepID=A0ABP8G6Q9_9SPHI
MKEILLDRLENSDNIGFDIKRIPSNDLTDNFPTEAHRDDHYTFFLLESGSGSVLVDFQTVQVNSPSLFFVLPGQVNQPVDQDAAKGWFLGVEASLMPTQSRDALGGQLMLQQPIPLDPLQLRQFGDLLNLILEKRQAPNNDVLYRPAIHALVQAFLLEVARSYSHMTGVNSGLSRPHQLLQEFKKLLSTEIKNLKSPSAYALQLHVTESYLNEVVKKISGFTVSYWIRHEAIMEAKRLLYYSELTSKEIAYELGYDDHSYFGRIFTKEVGMPAIAFRRQYRK